MSEFLANVSARFYFEAAHFMPNFPEGHPNRRLHGHTYTAEVVVRGPVNPHTGFVMDHGDLLAALKPLQDTLDHYSLNEIPGLELPTSECIARWMWRDLKAKLPLLHEIRILREQAGITVSYQGEGA